MRTKLAAATAALLVLAACSSRSSTPESTLPALSLAEATTTTEPATTVSPGADAPPDTAAAETVPPTTAPPAAIPDLPGSLVIISETGDLLVADKGRLSVAVPAPDNGIITQPTWGPDAGLLAYSLLDQSGPWLVITDGAGDELERISTPFVPFYLYWSPDGALVGALGAGPSGAVEFGVGDVGSGTFTSLSAGRAFFFDWSPVNPEIVSHAAPERLATVTVDGTETPLPTAPGSFQAPEWTPDGRSVILAISVAPDGANARGGWLFGISAGAQTGDQEVVLIDLETERVTTLVTYGTQIAFDLSPDGRKLAYTVALASGSAFVGPLDVLDLESGETERITGEPVLGFEWSPAGNALLYLSATPDNRLHWSVTSGGEQTTYSPQPPTEMFFLQYLPFWSQYARSMTLWAPDGSAFVYPLLTPEGEQEIWVQPLDADEPVFISTGIFAGWSH